MPEFIRFIPNPIQKRFVESRALADLFASRLGEGKSAGLCAAAAYYQQQNPGANVIFVRDTWENLKATTLDEFKTWFPEGQCIKWHAGERRAEWILPGMSGNCYFIGMDDPDDAARIASRRYAGFCVDEPAPAYGDGGISEEVFNDLISRRRQPGMKWYMGKLATNNPDEGHWTYKTFEDPGTTFPDDHPSLEMQVNEYRLWQTEEPENVGHLPPGYYELAAKQYADRPDLINRYVKGKFGFQQKGVQVTPEWDDDLHLTPKGVETDPIANRPLICSWDFGHNPTCTMAQITAMGNLVVHECHTDEENEIGVRQLIGDVVLPAIEARFHGARIEHTGDPAGVQKEQSDINQSAVIVIKKMLGGSWKAGPVKPSSRIQPLRALLRIHGKFLVSRKRAQPIHHALRGGWHYKKLKGGIIADQPTKDRHSHPGDSIGYLAARYFPLRDDQSKKQRKRKTGVAKPPVYFRKRGRTHVQSATR